MRPARVMIVEDSTALGETYRAMLLSDGHAVDLFPRSDEAIASLEKVLPSVLLIDVNLPDGNGLGLLRRMRAEAALPGATRKPPKKDKAA